MTADDARAEAWAERFFREVPGIVKDLRAEALWRSMAPNGLDLLIGEVVTDFGALRGVMSTTTPDEWTAVAGILEGLLQREPLRHGSKFSGERILIGTLANELRGYALSADRRPA